MSLEEIAAHDALWRSAALARWMKSTRYSRPMGHLGMALTFAMPYGVLISAQESVQ
jgi:ceramide glucosyltransferase